MKIAPPTIVRYSIPVAACGLALLITLWLMPISEGTTFLFFTLAVALSAWYGGVVPGLAATAISTLLVSYFVIRPRYELNLNDPADAIHLLLFILIGVTISFIGEERQRQAKRLFARARQQEAVAALGRQALSGASLTDLLDMTVKLVSDALGVEYSKVLELQPDANMLLLRAGVGWKAGLVGQATVETELNSQAGYTLKSKEPVVVTDFRKETRFSAPPLLVDHSVASGISVVIGEPGRPYGVLGAHSTRKRVFTRDDTQFLESVAAVLASAIEKERIAQALAESEQRFRSTFEQAAVGIAHVALDGRLLRVNQRLCEIVGYSYEESANLSFQEITHPDDLTADRDQIDRLLSGEIQTYSVEKRYFRKGGSMIWVNLTVSLSRTITGEADYFIVVIDDITDRKLDQEALRESEARLAAESDVLLKLRELSSRLWHIRSLPDGLDEMLAATMELLGADMGNVQILDQERGVLRIAAQRGFKQDFLDFFCEVSAEDDSACGRALRSGERIIIEDIEADDSYATMRPIARKAGYRAVQSTPLLARDGTPLAMLSTHWRSVHRPSEQDLRGLDLYARQAADLIERHIIDEALREREEILKSLFESASEAIIVVDGEGHIVSSNRGAEQIFGYEEGELLGQPLEILLPERARDAHIAHRARYAYDPRNRPMGVGLELYGRRKDGSEFPVEISLSYVRKGDGILVMSLITDITQRKLAEEKLRERAMLLDHAQEGIMVRDMQGRIVYWNKGAERLYGWTADEAIGMPAGALLYKAGSAKVEEATKAVIERGEWHGEIEKVTKDGRGLIVETRWSLVRDNRGQPREMFVVDIDITDRKRLEASLERASRFALLGELAAGLAHEIKNPLAGIKGMIDILTRRRAENDPERRDLEDMRDEVERIDRTVRSLLNRARPQAANIAPRPLNDIVERAVNLARRQALTRTAHGQRIRVEFDAPPDEVVVAVDESQFHDALLNIISNAIEAIEGGEGCVSVRLRSTGTEDGNSSSGEAIIEVEDDGRGIAESEMQRIFEPFFSTKPDGSGIGLAAVKRIIRAHGGQVGVRSTPGRGTVFTLRLPIAASGAARSHYT
ncbi:MAG TPA: PAS domain S-box protein [Blastocatellia bacterium]|nr:PAS domain S-box protein [Blastocatellia bacterium]